MRKLIKQGVLCLAAFGLVANASADYREHPKAQAFVNKLVEEHGFERKDVLNVLARAEKKDSILKAISRPAEKRLTWSEYQDIFLNKKRIDGGRAFLKKHKAIFDRVEKDYGVPREVITAIIGVETYYGGNKGSYRVIDSLATLGFDYPPRATFFEKQLVEAFLLAREQGLDISELTGSYAGAMGFGQFIPSSYRAYAIDYDRDGVADIWNNEEDAIGSVANYFAEHGWKVGAPIAHPVTLSRSVDESVINDRLKPKHNAGKLRDWGVELPVSVYGSEPAALVRYDGKQGVEHWAAWHNFYVTSRYNHSRLYVMAVYQLSQTFH